MKQITPQQREKAKRLAEVLKGGQIGLGIKLITLEDLMNSKAEEVKSSLPDLDKVLMSIRGKDGIDGRDGNDGFSGEKGEQGLPGKDGKPGKAGKNGLDGKDGVDGMDGIDGQIGEKGEQGSPDTAEQVRDKIESLEGDERLDIEKLKGHETYSTSIIDRAIAILDKRTQYLINKVVNTSATFITSLTTTGTSGAATVVNGVLNIPQYTGGGGSFAVLVPTGTVNGVNTTFVFTSAPSVIVLDNGTIMNKQNMTPDLTTNWTGTTTIILNQAPSFNIYGY